MKYVRNCCAIVALAFLACACSSTRLEPGGPYAPVGQAPDLQLFQLDSAFDFANSTLTTAFTLERNNRALLWKLSPDIKHEMDKLRVEAQKVRLDYAKARAAYKAIPVPAGLDTLGQILAKLQQLSITASTLLPKQQAKLVPRFPTPTAVSSDFLLWNPGKYGVTHSVTVDPL